MITFRPNLQNNRKLYILSHNVALVCALLLMSLTVHAQDTDVAAVSGAALESRGNTRKARRTLV